MLKNEYFLNKIELHGFKTFANKIKITFNSKITCISGPGGSGKTNIVFGINWVLGKQNNQYLQDNDYIFNLNNRKPMRFAKVSLIFVNNDKEKISLSREMINNGDKRFMNKNIVDLEYIKRNFGKMICLYNHNSIIRDFKCLPLKPVNIFDDMSWFNKEAIGNFINMVKENSKNKQFIIITRDKEILNTANTVYELGNGYNKSSRIVSVKIKEKEENKNE